MTFPTPINDHEYHSEKGYLSSTPLAKFFKSTYDAVKGEIFTSTKDTVNGHAFEDWVRLYTIYGVDAEYHWKSKYFLYDDVIAVATADKLFRRIMPMIDANIKEDLAYTKKPIEEVQGKTIYMSDPEYMLKKDGVSRSLTYKNIYSWIDRCRENIGKYPIFQGDFKKIKKCCDHLLDMDIELYVPGCEEHFILNVGELLNPRYCRWQIPHFWTRNGIKKKCLFDIMSSFTYNGVEYVFHIDLKYYAGFSKFRGDFQDGIWVQSSHYSEGAEDWSEREREKGREVLVLPYMIFLVGSKRADEFDMVKLFTENVYQTDQTRDKYLELCSYFIDWIKDGKPMCGTSKPKMITIYN